MSQESAPPGASADEHQRDRHKPASLQVAGDSEPGGPQSRPSSLPPLFAKLSVKALQSPSKSSCAFYMFSS